MSIEVHGRKIRHWCTALGDQFRCQARSDIGSSQRPRAWIHYMAAGENLAMAPTVSIAQRGLMNSPVHKKNILNPAFRRVGIGVYENAVGEKVFCRSLRTKVEPVFIQDNSEEAAGT